MNPWLILWLGAALGFVAGYMVAGRLKEGEEAAKDRADYYQMQYRLLLRSLGAQESEPGVFLIERAAAEKRLAEMERGLSRISVTSAKIEDGMITAHKPRREGS